MRGRTESVFMAIDGGLFVIDRVLRVLGALMMVATMIIVTVDVALRYAFNAPLGWSYDLIGIYLMAGIFFFLLSDTFRDNGHIAVDIVQNALGHRTRHICLAIVYLLSAILFCCIAWSGAQRAWSGYMAGEVLAGAIEWPIWLAAAFVPIGTGMLFLRLLLSSAGHAFSAILRRDVLSLPEIGDLEETAQ